MPAQNLILLDPPLPARAASLRAAGATFVVDLLTLLAVGLAAIGLVLLIQWAEWGWR